MAEDTQTEGKHKMLVDILSARLFEVTAKTELYMSYFYLLVDRLGYQAVKDILRSGTKL